MIAVELSKPGYGEDAAAVAAELANVPDAYSDALESEGIRVVACRGSVLDHLPHLADDEVRNWPAGSSWGQIPGVYSPQDRTVVIATRDTPGGRRVPQTGDMHGSVSLAVHETFHGFDYAIGHLKSRQPVFRAAWTADVGRLGHPYYTHSTAGPEESYAESAARAFGLDNRFANAWPNLASFWADLPMIGPHLAAPGEEPAESDEGAAAADIIGVARVREDGALLLDMRAESLGGFVGHGLLVIARDDPRYPEIAAHLQIDALSAAAGMLADEAFVILPFGP